MSRRAMVRRGIKKRGMLPSFGDMVLPIVSIAAVALLVIAGRQFFLNGLKSSPGISSTRAYAEAPALMAERGEIKSSDAEMVLSLANVPVSAEISKEPKLTETRPEPQNDFLAIAVAVPQAQSTKTISVATTRLHHNKPKRLLQRNQLQMLRSRKLLLRQQQRLRVYRLTNNGVFRSGLIRRNLGLKRLRTKSTRPAIKLRCIKILRQNTSKFGYRVALTRVRLKKL